MVDERIARRRREVREESRRRRLRRSAVVVVLLAVVVALLVVERSPLVELAEVRVEGVRELTTTQVVDTAELPLGTSLLRLDLDGAQERVEALPRVRTAEVHRVDPITVEIRVVERTPTLVARRDDDAVLVDEEGVVLAAEDLDGLMVVQVESGDLPGPGQGVRANRALANAATFDQELPGPTRSLVASMRAVDEDRTILVLSSGTEVEVGRATEVAAKARALAAVLEDLEGRSVTSIDVRAPSAPVLVP